MCEKDREEGGDRDRGTIKVVTVNRMMVVVVAVLMLDVRECLE